MKNFNILIVTCLTVCAIFSCKKDDETKPSSVNNTPKVTDHTMAGKWVGKYGYENDNPDIYYCFQIRNDGTLEEWNSLNDLSGEGNWDLANGKFSATTHFLPPYSSVFKLDANLDTSSMTITGTWGYSPSSGNGGKFYLTKKQPK